MKQQRMKIGRLDVEVAVCDRPQDAPYLKGRASWDGEKYFAMALVGHPTRGVFVWEGWVGGWAWEAELAGELPGPTGATLWGDLAQAAVDEAVQSLGGRA